jgi:hypothetical protein
VFGGVTAAGVIVAASPADIAAFASPMAKDAPLVLDVPPMKASSVGEHLYNDRGEVVAVIRSIDFHRQSIDVTMFRDSHQASMPGPLDFDIYAQGIGHVVWEDGSRFPRLIGVPRRSSR